MSLVTSQRKCWPDTAGELRKDRIFSMFLEKREAITFALRKEIIEQN